MLGEPEIAGRRVKCRLAAPGLRERGIDMKGTRALMVALFVLIAGAMSVVACGGDDDAKTSATATKQASTTATTAGGGGTTTTATSAATTETDAPAETQPPIGHVTASTAACDLLTKAEVEAALGETISPVDNGAAFDTPLPGGGTAAVSTCGFTSESFASSISLTFWNAPGLDQGIKGMIDLACSGHEEVSGVGDKACWYDQQHVQIQASKGAYFIDMFATMSGDASEVLKTLAEKAADRLG
jgi:hypothetical protein